MSLAALGISITFLQKTALNNLSTRTDKDNIFQSFFRDTDTKSQSRRMENNQPLSGELLTGIYHCPYWIG